MLGRKDYEQEEVDNGKRAIEATLKAYKKLVASVDGSANSEAGTALEAFEPLLLNTLTLALDRYYVHRLRSSTGKDGNPLNELELLTESLMNNDGVFRGNNVIKFVPHASVVKVSPGERIRLTLDDFERLEKAFFTDLERKFVKR